MLAASLAAEDPLLVEAFAGIYLIRLDIDEWSGHMSGSGFNVEVVPIFFRLDNQGKPTGDVIDGGAWGADTAENIARVMGPWFHSP